jgi:hypothetical protein
VFPADAGEPRRLNLRWRLGWDALYYVPVASLGRRTPPVLLGPSVVRTPGGYYQEGPPSREERRPPSSATQLDDRDDDLSSRQRDHGRAVCLNRAEFPGGHLV